MQLEILESGEGRATTAAPANDDQFISNDPPLTFAAAPAKRMLDIFVSIVGILFFGPIMLGFAIAIRLSDGGPAVFSQWRRGQDGQMFRCYKLRSMVPDAAERLTNLLAKDVEARHEWNLTQKLQKDPRITRIGRFIRKTSIDELPQFFNILKGDMSLVGPRPIVEKEVRRYDTHIVDYDKVRPGLTGLWQVSGRSEMSYSERVALDVKYANERTFWGDIKIALLTIPTVLFSRGAV